jgi:prefoldin subunit 5
MPPAFLGDDEKRAIYARIDELQRQLRDLEEDKRKVHKTSQIETLVVVGSGIGILMALDILCYLS